MDATCYRMVGTMTETFLSIAEHYSAGGLAVVPVTLPGDGEKRPDLDGWTQYQTRKPTAAELKTWFANGVESIGVITGDVSGGLEVVDVDDPNLVQPYLDTIGEWAPGLAERLPQDTTPRGGLHLMFRCPGHIAGNQKLARIADGKDERGKDKWKTLIETRGEGGFIVVSPTVGRYHPTGRPYVLRCGSLADIPTVTPEERAILLDAARVFDAYEPPAQAERPTASTAIPGKLRPGDDYEQRATWADVLEPSGWRRLKRPGAKEFWQRPGKSGPGASAIAGGKSGKTGFGGLYVYSSNAAPFVDGRGYYKFSAYALLNHGGDIQAAARELGQLGYGDQGNGHHEEPMPDYLEDAPPLEGTTDERPGLTHVSNQATQPAIDEPPNDGSQEPQGLPVIYTSGRPLRDITADALQALERANTPARLFIRSGALVRMGHDEDGLPVIAALSEAGLRGHMERSADYIGVDRKGNEFPIPPPRVVVQDLGALQSWPFPPLAGVIEAPSIRPSGDILDTPGYDAATRLFYAPANGLNVPPIPDRPTQDDARKAAAILADVIAEFPFDGGDDEKPSASRANAFATMLTPVLRPLIPGPVPLALIDKPQAGTGASLLAEVDAIIATGRAAAMMTAAKDDETWRKSITAMLRAGRMVVTIDNVETTLYAPSLAALLTANTWTDRVLGASEMVTLPHKAVWLATGNNIRLAGDLPRRCFWVRMDAKKARPWERTEFRHPQLTRYVAENRGAIVAAILTMARAWVVAGKPKAKNTPRLGGFEGWTETIGGILAYAGIAGFLGNQADMYDLADDDTPAWEAFLRAWRGVWPADKFVTVGEIVQALQKGDELRACLPEDLADGLDKDGRPDKGFTRRLGRALARRAGMTFPCGLTVKRGKPEQRATTWAVVGEFVSFMSLQATQPCAKNDVVVCGGGRDINTQNTQTHFSDTPDDDDQNFGNDDAQPQDGTDDDLPLPF